MFRHRRGRLVSPGGEPSGVVVANNNGAVFFYSSPWDGDAVVRLARWLMAQP